MGEQIGFSVIIPTFNGAHKIPSLINALIQQDYSNFEIRVVIDGSKDTTEYVVDGLLKSTNIRYEILKKNNTGRGSTRNYGTKEAAKEYLIFFDDDMVPEPYCLSAFADFHLQYPFSIAVGTQLEKIEVMKTDFQRYKAYLSRKWEGENQTEIKKYTHENLHLTAANFSLSKSVFDSLQGFDERLTDVEDFELSTRAWGKNIPIYYLPAAKAWHNDLITCQSYILRQRQYNQAYTDLLKFRPELLGQFAQTKFVPVTFLKRLLYWPFSAPRWAKWIDKDAFILRLIPTTIRYKLYDLVVWSQGKIFID